MADEQFPAAATALEEYQSIEEQMASPEVVSNPDKLRKLGRRHAGTPWACGYAYEERMSLTSGGVTHTLRQLCAPLYRKQPQLDLASALHGVSDTSWTTGWLLHGIVLALFILMAVGV